MELIDFLKDRKVYYKCSCGNETQSHISNILKEKWGGCAKCSNQRRGNMKNFEFARKIFEEGGEILHKQEYKGNKDKLTYTCSFCGEIAHVSLCEFRRGRRCEHCKRERAKETNIKKYGVENPFQSEVCKEKIRKTCLKKYGHDHHMQNPDISEKSLKSAYKGKTYTFPSGRQVHCQGFEDRCLDILLKKYNEDDILVERSKMPRIWYNNPKRNNQKSIYYPDMFIPKHKILIEVKSTYTLNVPKDKEINRIKFRTVPQYGYELHLYVFNHKTLLFTRIYTKDSFTQYPHNPAQIIFED